MKRNLRLVFVPLTLLAAAGIVAFVIWREDARTRGTVRVGFQDAAAPLEMPVSSQPDPRFQWLPPWIEAQVPLAEGFASIGGSPGEAVLAAADGLVIFTGLVDGERTIMLAHKGEENDPIRTIYRGLGKVNVVLHTLVPRGHSIGIATNQGASVEARRTWTLDLSDGGNRIDLAFDSDLAPSPLAKALELFESTPEPGMRIEKGTAEQ